MILNEGGKIPECTSPNKKHNFRVIRKPEGNRSGWHEEQCEICGQHISYDDSDQEDYMLVKNFVQMLILVEPDQLKEIKLKAMVSGSPSMSAFMRAEISKILKK